MVKILSAFEWITLVAAVVIGGGILVGFFTENSYSLAMADLKAQAIILAVCSVLFGFIVRQKKETRK